MTAIWSSIGVDLDFVPTSPGQYLWQASGSVMVSAVAVYMQGDSDSGG